MPMLMVAHVGALVSFFCWSGDRLSEPSTHPSFRICWLSCAACPVCHVCPVLRVFSAECAFSLCVAWVCGVGVLLFSCSLFACSFFHFSKPRSEGGSSSIASTWTSVRLSLLCRVLSLCVPLVVLSRFLFVACFVCACCGACATIS